MPNVCGWEILDFIKKKPETKDIPLIVLTGAAISSDGKERLSEKISGVMEEETFSLKGVEELLKKAV